MFNARPCPAVSPSVCAFEAVVVAAVVQCNHIESQCRMATPQSTNIPTDGSVPSKDTWRGISVAVCLRALLPALCTENDEIALTGKYSAHTHTLTHGDAQRFVVTLWRISSAVQPRIGSTLVRKMHPKLTSHEADAEAEDEFVFAFRSELRSHADCCAHILRSESYARFAKNTVSADLVG